MSRCVHIHGIYNVYNMYMLLLFFVYTCTELIPHCRIVWQLSLLLNPWEDPTAVGLRLPNELGQQRKPALISDPCLVYTWYIHGISSYIPGMSCIWVKHIFWVQILTIELLPCNPMLCASGSSYFHSFNVYVPNLNIAENGLC